MKYLRANTAATAVIGPFVDSTDGVTPETALTINQAAVRVTKNGGAFAAKSDATAATHMENGYYSVPLNATDTNTAGRLRVAVAAAGALPVWEDYSVLPAQVFDSIIAGTDRLEVDAAEITGAAALAVGIIDSGTAQAATATTMTLRAGATFADSAIIGATIIQTGGTNSPQMARVTAYVGSTDVATVAAWPNGTPGGSITYLVLATTPEAAGGGGGLDAAGVRAALGMAAANMDAQLGGLATSSALSAARTVIDNIRVDTNSTLPGLVTTVNSAVAGVQADTDNIQTRLPAALVGGRMDASVGAMAANVVTAAAIATDAIDADAIAASAVTEIQSGLATAATAASISSKVDTVQAIVDSVLIDTGTDIPAAVAAVAAQTANIAPIRAKTDQIQIDAGHVTASVQRVRTVNLTAGGTGGQGFGG
jgi:hypothetical protein